MQTNGDEEHSDMMHEQRTKPVVREAVPADYAALASISDEVHGLHAAAHPSIFREVGTGRSLPQAYFDDLLMGDMSTIQVAEVEGVVGGFAIVEVFDAPPFEVVVPRRTVFIASMAITEPQRRKGLGRALVDAAMTWGRAWGATSLELTVWEFNEDAIAFYERLGLAPLSRTMHLPLDA
jgi:GNAT superfamily N-acetyltransferase